MNDGQKKGQEPAFSWSTRYEWIDRFEIALLGAILGDWLNLIKNYWSKQAFAWCLDDHLSKTELISLKLYHNVPFLQRKVQTDLNKMRTEKGHIDSGKICFLRRKVKIDLDQIKSKKGQFDSSEILKAVSVLNSVSILAPIFSGFNSAVIWSCHRGCILLGNGILHFLFFLQRFTCN